MDSTSFEDTPLPILYTSATMNNRAPLFPSSGLCCLVFWFFILALVALLRSYGYLLDSHLAWFNGICRVSGLWMTMRDWCVIHVWLVWETIRAILALYTYRYQEAAFLLFLWLPLVRDGLLPTLLPSHDPNKLKDRTPKAQAELNPRTTATLTGLKTTRTLHVRVVNSSSFRLSRCSSEIK